MLDKNGIERCDYIHAHPGIIQAAQAAMPDEELLYDLAELYKVFGDSTRIKILYVLFEAEMCVCDIAQLLGMTQSAISHQLRCSRAQSWSKTGGTARRCFIPWRTTTCAPSSGRAWTISQKKIEGVL